VADEIKNMFTFRRKNSRQNHNMKYVINCSILAKLKYLGTIVQIRIVFTKKLRAD